MFVKNINQMTFTDPVLTMPKYLKTILEKSWATPFREYIFPNINEENFSDIYSKKTASRPNSPVNVIIGLLILKELFHLSDEELIGSLNFDMRYQYALWTTAYEKQPVSINTLTNFRRRVNGYEKESGIDLIQLEVEKLAEKIAKYLELDGKKVRMDSFMVSSSCKRLSRIELVYSVNAKVIKMLKELAPNAIPASCQAYLESGHKNETIYATRDNETESKLELLLSHAQQLFDTCTTSDQKVLNSEAYQLLTRLLEDQIDADTLKPRPGKNISASSLQNPTDPDATFRKKYGNNTGYVANVLETFDSKSGVITTYDLQANTYSDSKFADDVVAKLLANKEDKTEEIQLLVDGAYYKQERAEEIANKGIELIPGELVGRKPAHSYAHFTIDEEKKLILKCPYGKKPIRSSFKNGKYIAQFSKISCQGCPYQTNCPIKKQKKFNKITFTEQRYKKDLLREQMSSPAYIKLKNKRAGIEGIPSVFRRRYHVDRMPVRGHVRSKLWFGFKVAAYNFKKLLIGLKAKEAPHLFSSSISFLFYCWRNQVHLLKSNHSSRVMHGYKKLLFVR